MSPETLALIALAEKEYERLKKKGWTKRHFSLALITMIENPTQTNHNIECVIEKQLPLQNLVE